MDDIQEYSIAENQLLLVNDPANYLQLVMLQFIGKLASCNSVSVLDAGNTYHSYIISGEINKFTNNLNDCLNSINLFRALNHHQLLSRLETLGDPRIPVIVLNILSIFYNENETIKERERILHRVIQSLQQISTKNPVLISCSLMKNKYYQDWFANIRQYVDDIIHLEETSSPVIYRLF